MRNSIKLMEVKIDSIIELTDWGMMWRKDNNPRVKTQVVEVGEIGSDFELPFSVKEPSSPRHSVTPSQRAYQWRGVHLIKERFSSMVVLDHSVFFNRMEGRMRKWKTGLGNGGGVFILSGLGGWITSVIWLNTISGHLYSSDWDRPTLLFVKTFLPVKI